MALEDTSSSEIRAPEEISTQHDEITNSSQESFSPRKATSCGQQESYSVFTKTEKYTAVVLVAFTAIFSPLSSFVFFAAINALSEALHVSVEKINLTITSYMIIAGVAPAFVGDMADMTGRRNVYMLTLFIYVVANVGLALQDKWIALFLLRMLQSAGGAGESSTL